MEPDRPHDGSVRSRGTARRVPSGRHLPTARRLAALVLAAVGLPLLTVALVAARSTVSLPSAVLLFLLLVVVVALIGGIAPAVLAALAAFLLLNWYLTPPYGTLSIARRDHVLALVVFVAVALIVAGLVEVAAATAERAARSEAEARLVEALARSAPPDRGPDAVLDRLLATFPIAEARLEQREPDGGWSVVARRDGRVDTTGPDTARTDTAGTGTAGTGSSLTEDGGDVERTVPAPDDSTVRLVLVGPPRFAEDVRLLTRFATAGAGAVRTARLARQAAAAERLEAAEALRQALLAAVGHDLRTPLAGVKAAVSSLRQTDVAWSDEEQAELLATIEESADQLGHLITNLLDLSRIESGAVRVAAEPVRLDGLVAAALRGVGSPPVEWDVPEDLPTVVADPGLLERVVANLVANAVHHGAGSGRPPCVTATATAGQVRLAVVDSGPGVDAADLDRIFEPFQRLDDHGRSAGLGLGLAVVRGFVDAMGGTVAASPTSGGGLTVTVTLPVDARTGEPHR